MCSRVFPDSCCSSHFVRTDSNSWHEGAKATGNPSWDQTAPVKELTSLPLFKPGAAAFRGSSRPLAPQLSVWKPPLIVSSDIYSHSAISGSAETITGAFCQTWQPELLRLTSPCHSDSMTEPSCLSTNKKSTTDKWRCATGGIKLCLRNCWGKWKAAETENQRLGWGDSYYFFLAFLYSLPVSERPPSVFTVVWTLSLRQQRAFRDLSDQKHFLPFPLYFPFSSEGVYGKSTKSDKSWNVIHLVQTDDVPFSVYPNSTPLPLTPTYTKGSISD